MNVKMRGIDMVTEWRQARDFVGYIVSNRGVVKSLPREVIRSNGRKLPIEGKILKKFDNGRGYPMVRVAGKTIAVHRLVAEAFVENTNNLPEVNHKDGDKWNSKASNLEWSTRSDNLKHAYALKLREKVNVRGSNNPMSKLNEENVRTIREMYAKGNITQQKLADMFGVNYRTVSQIINNITWQEAGY